MYKAFNLAGLSAKQIAGMEEKKIEFSKLKGKLWSQSREDSKPEACLYCGQNASKFCRSHTMPASFLRNIAVDGKTYTTNKIIDIPLMETEKGINESAIFKVICRGCDGSIFQEYENPDNYTTKPTDKMIAQIAMKNHLRSISKRRNELSLFENMKQEYAKQAGGFLDEMLKTDNLDLLDYQRGFKRSKKVIEKNWKDEYFVFFAEQLDYVVPIAFQGEVALHYDLEGQLVNNVYNKSKDYAIQSVHVSVFPLKESSYVMLFYDQKHGRFRSFQKQFSALSHSRKLEIVNYIIFSYAEDVFMSKDVHTKFLQDKSLQQVSGLTSILEFDPFSTNKLSLKDGYDLSKIISIPNFLEKM